MKWIIREMGRVRIFFKKKVNPLSKYGWFKIKSEHRKEDEYSK